nr:uncharacterized protein LOC118679831 [Bactrocera oleae]
MNNAEIAAATRFHSSWEMAPSPLLLSYTPSSIELASLAISLNIGAAPTRGFLPREDSPFCDLCRFIDSGGTLGPPFPTLTSLSTILAHSILLLFCVHCNWVPTQTRYPSPEKVIAFKWSQGCLGYEAKARVDARPYEAVRSEPTSAKKESSQQTPTTPT